MSDPSSYEEAQMLARLTVLERIVGMMVRESMLKTGKGPQDLLAFGEVVKAFLKGRTPEGPSENHCEGNRRYRPTVVRSRALSSADACRGAASLRPPGALSLLRPLLGRAIERAGLRRGRLSQRIIGAGRLAFEEGALLHDERLMVDVALYAAR